MGDGTTEGVMMRSRRNSSSLLTVLVPLFALFGCSDDVVTDDDVVTNDVGFWEELPNESAPQATLAAATDGTRVAAVLSDDFDEVAEVWLWERAAGWTQIESDESGDLALGAQPLVALDGDGPVYLLGLTRPSCSPEPPTVSEGFVIKGEAWSPLPPAPLSLGCTTQVVDTGDSLVVLLDGYLDVLRFDKADETWSTFGWPQSAPARSLPDVEVAEVVGTAPLVVPVLEAGALPAVGLPLAALDVRTLEWLRLPALPEGFEGPDRVHPLRFVGAQDALVAWNGEAISILRDGRWNTAEPAPRPPTDGSGVAAVGTRVVIWGGFAPQGGFDQHPIGDGASYDLATQQWSDLAPSPLPASGWPIVIPLSETEAWIAAGMSETGDGARDQSTPWAILEVP